MILDVVAERRVCVKADSGRLLQLHYRIFSECTTICEEARVGYGLEAVLRDGDRVESRRFGNITCSRAEMDRIFRLIVEGVVFPEELEEIIGEILEEKIL